MTVENLEIKVTTDADKAAEQFNSLSKALEGIQSSAADVGKKAKKATEPLGDSIRSQIEEAGRYEIALHKVQAAEERMLKAFQKGNEDSAWRAREQGLNAEAAVEKYAPTVPLSTEAQEMIEAASAMEVLQAKAESLNAALQQAFASGDQDKAYALRGQIIKVNEQMERLENAAKKAAEAEKQTANATEKVANAAKKANNPLGNFVSSLKRIAFYRIIRGIIKSITQAMKEGLEWSYNFAKNLPDAVDSSGRFAAALDRMTTASSMLKAQLGSAFISLLSALEPILTKLIDLALKAADAISQFFAAFTGTTYIKATGGLVKAFQSGAKAAKEWKNQLLGFDEINRLNEPSNGGGGGTSPLSGITGADSPLEDWAKKIRDNLALIETAASGFALALGLILTLTGANIPLGLGLIALGATGMAHALKEDWSSVGPKIAKAVADVAAVVGGALLAVGALLTFTGANIPLGLGLMLAGATSIATAVAINWKAIPTTVGSVVSEILMILGGALLALGAVIMFATPSFSPLGLGLIVAGAAALAGGVAINWNNMPQSIGDVVTRILIILGGALVVLGIILCLTGAGIPLGIGLIMAGAASFAGAYAINAGAIIGAVQGACDHIWSIVSGLFQGIHGWIQNLLDGISQFLGLSAIGARADKMAADGSIYLQGFASGGFPQEGQLFLANDGSAPEMVGTMGGHTAVANNDQIVEGIRQGVYDAVMAANGNGNNDVNVKVYLDSREIRAGQERLARAWG